MHHVPTYCSGVSPPQYSAILPDITIFFAYVAFLGLTLRALFAPTDQVVATSIRQGRTHLVTAMTSSLADLNDDLHIALAPLQARRMPSHDPVVQSIDQSWEVLATQGRSPTWSTICELADLQRETILNDPGADERVQIIFAESRVHGRYRGIRAFVIQVVTAILVLRATQRPVSLTNVAHLLQARSARSAVLPGDRAADQAGKQAPVSRRNVSRRGFVCVMELGKHRL